jgi:pyrroline-5-carboxylate reductase
LGVSVRNEQSPSSIAFVGGGNMARAIIGGLLDSGYEANRIAVADPSTDALDALRAMGLSKVATEAATIVGDASLIVLAVKPQVMSSVVNGFAEHLQAEQTVMSIAAGISVAALIAMLGNPGVGVIRCMPNTPALVSCGASGLFAPPNVDEGQRQQAQSTMAAVGTTLWVNSEAQLDAVTAVSGSGPAYFFAFMEAMAHHGERLGLDYDQAYQLTLQTALGAARMAAEQNTPIDALRRNVTSPGGTTEQALLAFEQGKLKDLVGAAMDACVARAETMAREFN